MAGSASSLLAKTSISGKLLHTEQDERNAFSYEIIAAKPSAEKQPKRYCIQLSKHVSLLRMYLIKSERA